MADDNKTVVAVKYERLGDVRASLPGPQIYGRVKAVKEYYFLRVLCFSSSSDIPQVIRKWPRHNFIVPSRSVHSRIVVDLYIYYPVEGVRRHSYGRSQTVHYSIIVITIFGYCSLYTEMTGVPRNRPYYYYQKYFLKSQLYTCTQLLPQSITTVMTTKYSVFDV
jgi:hypothetical protein